MCVTAQSGSRRTKKEVKTRGTIGRTKLMGGHYPRRTVDVRKVRILIWWASENRLGKRLRYVCVS